MISPLNVAPDEAEPVEEPRTNVMSPLADSNMGYPLGMFNGPFDDSEISNYRPRQDNSLVKYERTGLDSLSGATCGQSKKYDPNTFPKTGTTYSKPGECFRVLARVLPKQNFDVIDRTKLDSFVKKNEIKIPKQVASHTGGKGDFDEIDYGFNGAINTN
ncbi:uncharacterized protein [Venturia canescens]|uniref:uncharacterized protein n=1 Tax=Venturia canescens TaxID=32260 RepID=UPI001C9D4603|nr:uncharacterized protein LOC122408412 [Venturia canescens]